MVQGLSRGGACICVSLSKCLDWSIGADVRGAAGGLVQMLHQATHNESLLG